MKRFIIAILAVFALPLTALAATPESILDGDDMVFVKYDPTQAPEVLTNSIEYFFGWTMGMSSEITVEDEDIETYLLNLLLTKPVSFSISTFSAETQEPEKFFLLIEVSQSEFSANFLPKVEASETITESATVDGVTIYTGDEQAFAYYGGHIVIALTADDVSDLITSNATKLSENSEFKKIIANTDDDSFLFAYVNGLEEMLGELSTEFGFVSSILETIQAEGVSVSETSKGIKIRSYLMQDAEKVAASGLDFSNTDDLRLHEFLPSNNLIYFYNGKNVIGWSQIFNELSAEVAGEEFGDEFESGMETFSLLLEKEMAMTIEDNGAIFPDITFLSDVKDNRSKLESMIESMITSAWEELSFEADSKTANSLVFLNSDGKLTVTKKAVSVDGEALTQFGFNFQFTPSKNPYAIQPPSNLFEFKVTIGITDDNVFLLSTNKDIATEYGTGVEGNNKISALLLKKPDDVAYLDFDNINGYLQNVLNIFESFTPGEEANFNALSKNIDNALDPWSSIETVATYSNTYIASDTNINVNLAMAEENYTADKWLPFDDSGLDKNFNQSDFDDVSTTEWYGDDVYYLTSEGIIGGYADGTFKPTQPINRAEFTKLIVEILEKEGLIVMDDFYYAEEPFTDVDYFAWYYDTVSQAKKSGIIGGYPDGSFHPDGNISRAEAASIINNVLKTYNISGNLLNVPENVDVISFGEFKDVTQEKWYNVAITDITTAGIMSGKNADYFGPDENLNRAEAAKIIRNLIELIQAQ